MASILRVDTLTDASSNNSTATSTIFNGTAKAWVYALDNAINYVEDQMGGAKVIGPLLIGLGQPIEIAPLRSSTSDILNLASVAAYSAGVISYNKKN